MKFDWNNWNSGAKVIFIAGCAATLSMFMKWVHFSILNLSPAKTGLTCRAFLFLGLWVYPLLMLFKNKPINRAGGLICSITSTLFTLAFISSRPTSSPNGPWIFLFASIALIVGVCKYAPVQTNVNGAEQADPADG